MIALLVHHIKSIPVQHRPRSASPVGHLLGLLKGQILGTFIAESNPRAKLIGDLFEDIIGDVVAQVVPKPSGAELDANAMEQSLRAIPSLPMHEDESSQLPVPPELVQAVAQLALPRLNLDPPPSSSDNPTNE